MKIRTFLLAAAAIAAAACQTPEEKVQAYEAAHEAMVSEFQVMMDSLSADQEKAQAYYEEFIEEYKEFNLKAAKKNADNDVARQALLNLYGMIEDAQIEEILAKMPEEMLQEAGISVPPVGTDAAACTLVRVVEEG